MKKNLQMITATALVLMSSQVFYGGQVSALTLPQPLQPVQDGTWDDYGVLLDSTENYVGLDSELGGFGFQRSALQFNLEDGIPSNFVKARLRIYITNVTDQSVKPQVNIYGSSYGEWSDTDSDGELDFPLNSNDPPILVNAPILAAGDWVEFDVTDYVRDQLLLAPQKITLVLLGNVSIPAYFGYSSNDDPIKYPRIVFEYQADPPQVTSITTPIQEDDVNWDGLRIQPSAADIGTVTHFQITGIHGGKLYQNDETTEIPEGSYITYNQGDAGLKFKPNQEANSSAGDTFGFTVKAAKDANGTGLSTAVPVEITVSEVNDQPQAGNDPLDSIGENSGDRIIPISTLLGNDTAGPANENSQTLHIQAVNNPTGGTVRIDGANVIFTPASNYRGAASFEYIVEDNGTTNGASSLKTAQGTVSFNIDAPADEPLVANAATAEDTLSMQGLVITPRSVGGSTTTHYKISNITGGRLYHNDGTTPVNEGSFITVSEGGNGLKFMPTQNANGTTGFGFDVQAAPGTTGSLLSVSVPATITVTEVNDAPTAQNDTLQSVNKGVPLVAIPFSALTTNDQPGPLDEISQTLTVTAVNNPTGGTVSIANGQVEFIPDPSFQGRASFTYTIEDNGTTNGSPAFQTVTAQAEFDVQDASKPGITLNGDQAVYLLVGQPYTEPGFTAYDDVDLDLTNQVAVSGSVDSSHPGTYSLHYNVTDMTGNAATEVTRTVHVVSADLSAFTVNSGTLAPAFQPGTQSYTLSVPHDVSSLTLSASLLDPTATMTVNGVAKTSGSSSAVNLQTGDNHIALVVTAQGGSTSTYELVVTRQAASSPAPAPAPAPVPSSGHSITIPEQQNNLNERAKEAIQESTDGKWIHEQVEESLEHLSDVVEPSNVQDTTKLELVSNTVTDVFVPLVTKWEKGVISGKELNEMLETFLETGLNKVINHVDLEDERIFEQGKDTVDTLINQVISKLDSDQVEGDIATKLGEAMNRLLETKNVLQVEESTDVDNVKDRLEQIDSVVSSWSNGLDDKADMFDLERHLLFQVSEESHAAPVSVTAAEPTVSFTKEIVKQLADRGFVVTVKNEDGASMKLPTVFFTEYKGDDVAFIVEANKAAKVPSNYAKASDAYAFRIFAGEKEISSFRKGEILISIPYDGKSKTLTPYSYDAKRKSWKQLTSSKSKPVNTDKINDVVRFQTNNLATFMLAETGVRIITLEQKTVKLEPGTSQPIKVTGTLASGRKVDLSASEDGTIYTSSKPEVMMVSEDGLLTISPDAKDGTKATVTVKNGKSTTKMSVIVHSMKNIAVSPSKTTVTAGKKLQLKVYAIYSDKSKTEITKESAGTAYTLDDDQFATISKDGLLEVSEDAPDKTVLTITVVNGEFSATNTVQVKKR
ncbi:immunoglobulin-like domain-containing protein [Brevibacillus migulae]|uniref:immunoglobulin-like domain-containing protein n=1 Tax=Brevibacillus migulae TaxID=1644114 RepID=UPI001431DDB6|nr:Ig-like domain-containing protein [Brevibacillus migulae]